KQRDPQRFSLLIFGGSQGSRAINEAMVTALPHLESHRERMQVTHQTGKLDFEKVRAGYVAAGWKQTDVREYIDAMVTAFAENDLIVSRAGATTSFELMAAGKPALMVPLPGQLEQTRNAEVMQQAGAARLIRQEELTGERLAKEIASLMDQPDEITRMEACGRKLARRDAAAAAVDLMERVMRRQ
ncbi:MAG: UDP-N-acetylglucosamine--N-acetylmuramyl-(pentapeptide) pyrophosphoryl-undecaprenol N-acetylglucosamine transferase, partial [Acidobacteriota bacterium]